jgi:iron complex transport system permease protein
MTGRNRWIFILPVLIIALIVSIVASVGLGPTAVPLEDIFHDPTAQLILFSVRLPRVLAAVLVGCGLAAAGTAMQGLFKNSMADPYIIGTSSGGALGAALAIVVFGGAGLPVLAFLGATLAAFIVYAITMQHGRAHVETLLLSGIALSMFLSAILSFLMYSAGKSLHQIMFWLMGGFWNVSWSEVGVAILIPVGCVILGAFSRDLNVLSLGEEDAMHLGVSVERLKQILLFLSAFITGIAVSIAGAIGFIGLITPHVIRLITGPDHRILLPSAMIAGGILLLWSDTLARSVANEIPVGVITSFFGAPFFIYLLRRRMRA